MTSKTRCFIELADLLAWRFECKNCHASLELSLDNLEKGTLNECPHCHRNWALIPTTPLSSVNFEPHFTRFIEALNQLKGQFGDQSVLGFDLSLEIKQPESPAHGH